MPLTVINAEEGSRSSVCRIGFVQVTLRFLGGLDSAAVVRPLVAAIGDQRIQSNCRELSLRMLRDAPPEILKPSLERAGFDTVRLHGQR
jgi:hypothetical protein